MPTPAHVAPDSDDVLIGVIGLAAAGVVLASGSRPTGALAVDVVVIGASVGGVVWACSAAQWWAIALLGVLAAVAAGEPWGTALGALGALGAIATGLRHRPSRLVGAGSAGLSVIALATIGEIGRFGTSAAVAIVIVTPCAALGIAHLARPARRRILLGSLLVGGVVVTAVAGLAIAGLAAQDDLREGNRAATSGLDLVREGDVDAARAEFAEASVHFGRAAADLRQPWAQLARLVPIAAQHRASATDLSRAAASSTRALEAELRAVDLDALQIIDGRIDVDAVSALQAPMDRVNVAIGRLDEAVAAARSGWLVDPIRTRLDELADDLAEPRSLGARAAEALAVAPAMLGADGPRTYFVMFTTPAEARGQGGFMGNYAELTIDDGRIELTSFGRHDDLSTAGDRPRVVTDAPPDWLDRYGPFGFTTGVDGSVGEVPWANITMSPNFPATAEVVAELYPQSGGRSIDGVVSLDVFALERVVGLVGPLDVPGAPEPLHGGNTASFLLVGQYDIDDIDERTDLLEAVALETVDELLGGSAPDPIDLGRELHPMVKQRRLLAWSEAVDEQAMLHATGLAGGLLTDRDGAEGIAITVVNASGNKIDTFLTRNFTIERTGVDDRRLGLELAFGNDPPSGLPDYVVGNLVDLPRGSSRLFVSVHTSWRLVSARDRTGSLGLQASIEAGLPVYSGYLDIGPGETETWRLVLESDRTSPARELRIQPQPLVVPERWRVSLGDDRRSPAAIGEVVEPLTIAPFAP